MQVEQQSPEINTRRVAFEMLLLMARALLLGVVVAIVVSVPVIWIAMITP